MRIRVALRHKQRRRLRRRYRKTRCRVEALRCRILLLLDEGFSVAEVGARAGCVRATVYRTVYRFEDLGMDSLPDQRTQRAPHKVSGSVEQHLLDYLDREPKSYGWHRSNWTLELLARQLALDSGVQLSHSCIHGVLRRAGCRRGRPRPGLQIPVRGRRQVLEAISRIVAAASSEEEVFYQDEADVHLNPKIGLTYLKRGQQRVVLTPGKNIKRHVFGLLNVRTGRIIHGVAVKKTADMFIESLKHLQRLYRRARTLHIVLDNYIIHKSRSVQRYLAEHGTRVALHFLPPYSPNDNPIERLWKQMHDHVTRNHKHPGIDALVADVIRFLEHAQPFPGTQVSTLRAA